MLSQSWTLQFHGDQGSTAAASLAAATKRCRSAMSALRLSSSSWLELWAFTPNEEWAQLFVSPDKSPSRRATEVATKKLAEIVSPLVPTGAGEVKTMKPEGVIFINWVPLVKVIPLPSGIVNLEWNNPLVGHLNLDKEAESTARQIDLQVAPGLWW